MPDTTSSMPTTSSSSRRPGGWRRWWRTAITITRGDLITFLVAVTLCSASYYLAIRKNGQNTFGVADRPVLGSGAAAAAAAAAPSSWPCGSDAHADEPVQLDFETHHSAENAGLSVSANSSAAPGATTPTTGARRRALLSGAAATWAGNSDRVADAADAAGARR